MATKLDKMLAYDIGPPRTKSHDSLITWSYVVSWQMNNVTSPIAQVLWTLNLTGWWRMTWGYLSKNYITLRKKFLPFILKNNFMAPFCGWGSTASRLEPLRGDSLLFTTKSPEIPGTHLIDLGTMKGWVDLGASHSVVLKSRPLDWESSALTKRHIFSTPILYLLSYIGLL